MIHTGLRDSEEFEERLFEERLALEQERQEQEIMDAYYQDPFPTNDTGFFFDPFTRPLGGTPL